MQVIENELRPPADKEVRVRVFATSVCLPDVQARYGQTPIAPKVPFTPGYAIVGDVEAVLTIHHITPCLTLLLTVVTLYLLLNPKS